MSSFSEQQPTEPTTEDRTLVHIFFGGPYVLNSVEDFEELQQRIETARGTDVTFTADGMSNPAMPPLLRTTVVRHDGEEARAAFNPFSIVYILEMPYSVAFPDS